MLIFNLKHLHFKLLLWTYSTRNPYFTCTRLPTRPVFISCWVHHGEPRWTSNQYVLLDYDANPSASASALRSGV